MNRLVLRALKLFRDGAGFSIDRSLL